MKKLLLVLSMFVSVSSFAEYRVLQDEQGNAVGVTAGALNVSGSFNVSGSTLNVNVNGIVPVSGPLTDTELRATPVPVSGTVSVGNFPAVQAVNDNGGSLTVDGTVAVSNLPATSIGTSTVTLVSVSPSGATLAANNSTRIKLIVFNETGTLYLKLGTGSSSSSYTYRMTANETREITGYSGPVSASKASGTTNVLVTEL